MGFIFRGYRHRVAGDLLVNHNIPLPLFFVSVDCEGVEIICFDRLLQVFILRDLLLTIFGKKFGKCLSLRQGNEVRVGGLFGLREGRKPDS